MSFAVPMLGDSLQETKAIDPGSFDLVLADPPYGGIVGDDYDKVSPTELTSMLLDITLEALRLLKPGGSLILFGGVGTYQNRPLFSFLSKVENSVPNAYIRDVITWKKCRGYGSQTRYLFTREEIIWITNGPDVAYFDKPYLDEEHSAATKGCLKGRKYQPHRDKKRRSNVWTDITEIMRGKLVSAQKPLRLYDVIIEAHCPEHGTILDMFGGSGTSAVSAKHLNRNILIFEKDPKVFKIMKENTNSLEG